MIAYGLFRASAYGSRTFSEYGFLFSGEGIRCALAQRAKITRSVRRTITSAHAPSAAQNHTNGSPIAKCSARKIQAGIVHSAYRSAFQRRHRKNPPRSFVSVIAASFANYSVYIITTCRTNCKCIFVIFVLY